MTPTNPESVARRKRLERDPAARFPLESIERGGDILALLDAHLYLSNDQVELALFHTGPTSTGKARSPKGSSYAANTALRRLFDTAFIDRVPAFLPGRTPRTVKPHYLNVLSASGARVASALVKESGEEPRWRRSLLPHPWQPLLHGYWIRQFAVAGKSACASAGVEWWSWWDDRHLAALRKTRRATFGTVPDGFVVMTNRGKDFPHFLEIDLGTESVAARSVGRVDWRGKVESYLRYFDRGFREEFGFDGLPLVLTVTESERRLEHLLAATATAGGGGRFWFATLADLLAPAASDTGAPSAMPEGPGAPFWRSVWRVPTSSRPRSLASRLGASSGS